MGLMPSVAPEAPGLSIPGRCLPAKQVGGDFFQYFREDVPTLTSSELEAATLSNSRSATTR